MTKKVQLPKNICDALDAIQIDIQDKARIFHDIYNGSYSIRFPFFYEKIKNKNLKLEIMRALVLGYEPEWTPEEKIKALIFCSTDSYEEFDEFDKGFYRGALKALHSHGIYYEWLKDDDQ